MRTGTLTGLIAATILACFASGAFADAKEGPYQVIIQRNPFGLREIPPPAPPVAATEPTNAPTPLDIKLTGISNLYGDPRVFLEIINTQTKKTERPRPMVVGDEEFGVQIIAVDPLAGTVRVRNGNAESTLDFDKNGIKPAAVAGTPVPPVPGSPQPIPAPRPAVPVPNTPGVSAIANPAASSSSGIVVGNNSVVANAPGVPVASASFQAGNVPPRPMRINTPDSGVIVTGQGQPIQQPQQNVQQQPQMSREQAEILIEARRREMQDREAAAGGQPGMSRIMPPTRFSAPLPPTPQGQ